MSRSGVGLGSRRARAAGALLTIVTGSLLAFACQRERVTPEDEIRRVLGELEEGATARDAGAMKQHVSEAYSDREGHDKPAIAQLVAFHLLRNQRVYLLTRVRNVAIVVPGQGSAEVLVAMAGTPIEGPEALLALRADLYRFDLQLAKEPDGAWRIRSAQWRPAAVDDFR